VTGEHRADDSQHDDGDHHGDHSDAEADDVTEHQLQA
jgi:hypothetical protein